MFRQALEKLIYASISCRLEFCSSLYQKKTVGKLQLIKNTAARVLTRTRRTDHINSLLESLHWQPVRYRVDFKALLLGYKSLHGVEPKYLWNLLVVYKPSRALRSVDCDQMVNIQSEANKLKLLCCTQMEPASWWTFILKSKCFICCSLFGTSERWIIQPLVVWLGVFDAIPDTTP